MNLPVLVRRHAQTLRRIVLAGIAAGVTALIFSYPAINETVLSRAMAAGASGSNLFRANGMPYELFDELPVTTLKIMNGSVDVAFMAGKLDLPESEILDWIARSATAMAKYYGRFPVKKVQVLIIPVAGRSIHGTSFGYDGAAMKVAFGESADQASLARDWVMTHEMIHTTFPSLSHQFSWIEEGIATYVEPVARVQDGQLSPAKIWGDMVTGMPQGLPRAGDQGLDHTHTWARTYWGGALFCLLADVRIRERTHNHFGLQDALRAITAAGGSIETTSTLDYALQIGDKATGVPVLAELYAQMKDTPQSVDLADLWQRLGVEVSDGGIVFNDAAPLAKVRRAITRPPADSVNPAGGA